MLYHIFWELTDFITGTWENAVSHISSVNLFDYWHLGKMVCQIFRVLTDLIIGTW